MNSVRDFIINRLTFSIALICSVLLGSNPAFAQKYTFTHYDIENGLIQSQVNRVYQDNEHRLWIGTLGGACRYDGMDYYSISKAGGLINNYVSTVFCDRSGTTWFGTNKGLARLKNGKLESLANPEGLKLVWVSRLTQDAAGTVWGIMYNHLFKINGNRIQLVTVNGLPNSVTTVAVNKQGKLLAALIGSGIYQLDGNSWKNIIPIPDALDIRYILKLIYDKNNPNRLFIQAYKGIYTAENGVVACYEGDLLKEVPRPFLSMEQDAGGNIWFGTNSAAYRVKNGQLTKFDSSNGFSDASVSDIYNDKDNNLWFGTQGDGLYRYDGDDYRIYTRSETMKDNPIVMGLTRDQGTGVLAGIDGGGVALYNGVNLQTIWKINGKPSYYKVESIYKDHAGTVWIGTNQNGLWKYDGKNFTQDKGTEGHTISHVAEDNEGHLWVSTPTGAYYYDDQHVLHSTGLFIHSSSIVPLGRDSMLLGTQDGVVLMVNKNKVPGFKINMLGSSAIFCITTYKQLVLIGTDDEGIFIWDRATGRVSNYQVKDGLKSNAIYSMAADEYGLIWAGTGRGVNRLSIDTKTLRCKIFSSDDSQDRIIESNQNAILYYDHQMFVGTTKGLAVYNTALPVAPSSPPHIVINAVKIFEQGNPKVKILNMPPQGSCFDLSSGQNHLTIYFLGVYLKSPENVMYQYRLKGLEDKFSAPAKNDMVSFPALPPGHYTFEVRAINGEGQVSKNMASFCFEIAPPFYRTYVFQLGVILLLIFIGVGLQHFYTERKLERQRAIEAMKREEKLKIRQQTAEDFHDDLGNKLTRITVLSDILDAKLDADKTEHRKLVQQIKQNASALYNGTRDILWAMDPKSDNLFEVLNHIKNTGIEIFEDTAIEFAFEGINGEQAAVKLPMEYSRNITMIFKELLNNVLKHAGAHNVKVSYTQADKDEGRLRVTDDGTGFDIEAASKGHGLNNIKARAKRIGGELAFETGKGGTTVELVFRTNKKG